MENDNAIVWFGFDGEGQMVRGSAHLDERATILTLKGGDWKLETNGTNPCQLLLTSAYEDGKCLMVW